MDEAVEWRPWGESERERNICLDSVDWYIWMNGVVLLKILLCKKYFIISPLSQQSTPSNLPLALFHTLPALISLFSLISFLLSHQIWNVWQVLFRLQCRCARVFLLRFGSVTNSEPEANISEARHLKHYSFIILGFLSETPWKSVRSALPSSSEWLSTRCPIWYLQIAL